MGLGLNVYHFEPGVNPYDFIHERMLLADQILGVQLPIYVLEGGLLSNENRRFSEDVHASDISRLLTHEIPAPLVDRLKSFNLWLYASTAKNNPGERMPDHYDYNALRLSKDIVTSSYHAIASIEQAV